MNKKQLLACALSGAFYVLSFPEPELTFLVWVTLIPWLWALGPIRRWRDSLLGTALMALIIGYAGFYWVAYSIKTFGELPWAIAALGLGIFSIFGQLQLYAYAAVRIFLRSRKQRLGPSFLEPVFLGILYAGIDWILPKLFRDTLGHGFLPYPHLRQVADIGGAHLLTALIVTVSETVVIFLELPKAMRIQKWKQAVPAALLVILAMGYGIQRRHLVTTTYDQAGRKVQVAVIQANIGDIDKIASEKGHTAAADSVVNTYLDLTREALLARPRPEVIVWPETAFPSTFKTPQTPLDAERQERILELVSKEKFNLFLGAYDTFEGKDFNSLFLTSPSATQIYHKNILLPFGEFIPIIGNFKWTEKLFPQVGNFGRGPGPQAIPVQLVSGSTLRVGPIICYEALFPNYTRHSSLLGNELMINVTNDSWFGAYGEPKLHLWLTVFRSIETHVPQIRATNTGISALIEADGTLVRPTPVFTKGAFHYEVKLAQHSPPVGGLFLAWGDWFGPFALALSFLMILFNLARRRSTSANHSTN